jgi:preprotein translocase subunit SecE
MGVERALRRWLDGHQLFGITVAVLGVIALLAIILVVGGYWLVTP